MLKSYWEYYATIKKTFSYTNEILQKNQVGLPEENAWSDAKKGRRNSESTQAIFKRNETRAYAGFMI